MIKKDCNNYNKKKLNNKERYACCVSIFILNEKACPEFSWLIRMLIFSKTCDFIMAKKYLFSESYIH